MCDKIIKLTSLNRPGIFEQQNRVYSTKGISPTLNSAMGHGGGCIPLFLIIKEIWEKPSSTRNAQQKEGCYAKHTTLISAASKQRWNIEHHVQMDLVTPSQVSSQTT